ncbi:MAG: helix-turn-helix transcriptional regulator [Bacilli bacterium]|nr:helix-turn-helix transcriptional regulator [Bacilli bacterium]
MNRTIGEKIRDIRIDMDLSQKEVASMIPMNQSNYSKIERDIQEPNVYQLKRISEILNTSIDEILGINKKSLDEEKLNAFQKEFVKLCHKYFF